MKKILSICFVLLTGSLFAQTSLSFYNFRTVGQSYFLNPALPSRQAFTLGILDQYNHLYLPGITMYDLFRADETADETLKKIINGDQYHLQDIQINNEINPLFVGFRIKRNYFTFGTQINLDHSIGLPKEMLALAYFGNANPDEMLGKTIEFSDVQANLSTISSVYFGYTRDINEKLTVGFRAKYNMGIYNLEVLRNTTTLKTDSGDNNAFRMTATTDYEYRAAGLDRIGDFKRYFIPKDSIEEENYKDFDLAGNARKYYTEPVGRGYSIDLGVNYRVNNKLSVSASVLNLGKMTWIESKSYAQKATFVFEGFVTDDPSNIDSTTMAELVDSLKREFQPVETTIPAYKTRLNSKIYLGASYNLFKSGSIGLVGYGEMWKDKFYPGFSVSYTQRVWKLLDIRVNYNLYRDQTKNVGLALAMNMGPLVFYTATDNILGWAPLDGTLKLDAHYTNFRFGININIGGRYDRDNDGVPDRKDECKKVPGLVKFNGCPDTDNDSVPDSKDQCLGVKGTVLANGCPDIDGDGVKDLADSCMNEKGVAALNGCPDKDNDGVADKDDQCPDAPGEKINAGCPDRDKDGVLDKADECPDDFGYDFTKGCPDTDRDSVPDKVDECVGVPGTIAMKGCPDIDGDGIANKDDDCPAEFGPIATKGCPDADKDGIADKNDACPNEAGTAELQGCPQPAPTPAPEVAPAPEPTPAPVTPAPKAKAKPKKK